ncbi:MAG: hypothetical protein M0Z94_03550 [Dehalococcoidales bacterium]|nr:hypothetical protein [Dehalococcoidales bacterium]
MLNAVVLFTYVVAGFVLVVLPLLRGRGDLDPFSEVDEHMAFSVLAGMEGEEEDG